MAFGLAAYVSRVGFPPPRKTGFQVLVRLSWAGFHPQGSDKRFQLRNLPPDMTRHPHPQDPMVPPTPTWLIAGLLVVEGLLWLSERFQWFDVHKGYAVLIAVACVGVVFVVMLLWLVVALVFHLRFQFSIGSLLIFTVAVAIPCSWLSREMKAARGQRRRWEGLGNSVAACNIIGNSMRRANRCQTLSRQSQGGCGACWETISSERL